MNKKEYKRVIASYGKGKVPEKLIVEMLLHSILSQSTYNSDILEEAVSIAALRIDEFYKTEVLNVKFDS